MRKKQYSSWRGKSLVRTNRPKNEKIAKRSMSDTFKPPSHCPVNECCKKKGLSSQGDPGMDNRSRLPSRSGTYYQQHARNLCHRYLGTGKASQRPPDSCRPQRGCYESSQATSTRQTSAQPARDRSWPLVDADQLRPRKYSQSSYPVEGGSPSNCSITSKFERQPMIFDRLFKAGDDIRSSTDYKQRTCNDKKWSSCNYAPDFSPGKRSWNSITAEFSQPRRELDNLRLSNFESGSISGNYSFSPYLSRNNSHASPSFKTNYNNSQYVGPSLHRSFTPSATRPKSASGYRPYSSRCTDYRDDMSTTLFNGLQNENSSSLGGNSTSFTPSLERKSFSSQLDVNTGGFGTDDINVDSFLRSLKGNSHYTPTGLRSEFAWNSSYNEPPSTHAGTNASKGQYDFSHLYSSDRNLGTFNLRSCSGYETGETNVPSNKQLTLYMNNHLDYEKERLNKVANMIGMSTYHPHAKL